MATVTAKFDSYKIFYFGSYPHDAYYEALIYCYLGSTFVGRIEFYKPDTATTTLASTAMSGQPRVRYRIDRFADVQRILLNEKPLYLSVNETNGIGTLGTAEREPTGSLEAPEP